MTTEHYIIIAMICVFAFGFIAGAIWGLHVGEQIDEENNHHEHY